MKYLSAALTLGGLLGLTGCSSPFHYVQDADELSDAKAIKATDKEYGLSPSEIQIKRISNGAGLNYTATMRGQEYRCRIGTYRALGSPFLKHGTPSCKDAAGNNLTPFNR